MISGLETRIERAAFGGKGIGRLADGKVCFVSWVIPGERVAIRLRKERAGHAEAELAGVLEASTDRVEPPCPVFGRCGGCRYQHVAYARQLVLKRDLVADALARLGGLRDARVEDMVPSPQEYGYRNRITVHVRRGEIGFYAAQSRQVVPISRCPIATDRVNDELRALIQSRPADGEYPLREPADFRGFRQVNAGAAEALLQTVEEMAEPGGGLLVDVFCGAGFFAKRLKPKFRLAIGIEWSADAIRSARQNASGEEIYLLGDVKRHLAPALAAGRADETTVLLDPPQEGLEGEVLEGLLCHRPARLIYVSCNPSTLARDLKKLGAAYGLRRVRPIDMFPQTAEIETVSLLELR